MSYSTGLAIVRTFASTDDADAAKGVLQAAGVDSIVRLDVANPARRELLVRTDDAAKAKDALARASERIASAKS